MGASLTYFRGNAIIGCAVRRNEAPPSAVDAMSLDHKMHCPVEVFWLKEHQLRLCGGCSPWNSLCTRAMPVPFG